MGLLHGAYCPGCCWLLFITPFLLGMSVIGRENFALASGLRLMPQLSFTCSMVRVFGRLSEDVSFRLALVVRIIVLFIAANAARPKR